MDCLKVAPSGTLASPHPSVENGNGFEGDSDCHTGGQSKVCLAYPFSLS